VDERSGVFGSSETLRRGCVECASVKPWREDQRGRDRTEFWNATTRPGSVGFAPQTAAALRRKPWTDPFPVAMAIWATVEAVTVRRAGYRCPSPSCPRRRKSALRLRSGTRLTLPSVARREARRRAPQRAFRPQARVVAAGRRPCCGTCRSAFVDLLSQNAEQKSCASD
jgi:hypothetical protein